MPRTDAVAPSGCPALRALTFDNLGLIKVVENTKDNGHPQIVARWGEPNPKRSIIDASLSSHEGSQVLAVARKNLSVEILDPCSGAPYKEVNVPLTNDEASNISRSSKGKESEELIGVCLLRARASRMRAVLTCTNSGKACVQRILLEEAEPKSSLHEDCSRVWQVCRAGSILCMKADPSEQYAAFGGNGADASLWDISTQSRIWEAKAPRRDSNGLMSPSFVTALAFLGNEHEKLVVGTGHHQIRLYDIRAMRRPTLAFDFRECPIKAVEADSDGFTVFVGTGNGDLASFDMRIGKLLGAFKGKISGSIRSIAVHPSLPVFAACGLDRYLRIFHKSSRQLLTHVFLKQQQTAVVFDSKYPLTLHVPDAAAAIDEESCALCKSEEPPTNPPHVIHALSDGTDGMDHRIAGKLCKKRKSKTPKDGEELAKKRKKRKGVHADVLLEDTQPERKSKKVSTPDHEELPGPSRVAQDVRRPAKKKKKRTLWQHEAQFGALKR